MFIFESQGDGSDLRHYLTEGGQVINKNRVGNFRVDIREGKASCGTNEGGQLEVGAAIREPFLDRINDCLLRAEINSNVAIRYTRGRNNILSW